LCLFTPAYIMVYNDCYASFIILIFFLDWFFLEKKFIFLIFNTKKNYNVELHILKISPDKNFIKQQLKQDNGQKVKVKSFQISENISSVNPKTVPKVNILLKNTTHTNNNLRKQKRAKTSKSLDWLNERIKLNEVGNLTEESCATSKHQIIEPLEIDFDTDKKEENFSKIYDKTDHKKIYGKGSLTNKEANFANKEANFANKEANFANKEANLENDFTSVPPKVDVNRPNRWTPIKAKIRSFYEWVFYYPRRLISLLLTYVNSIYYWISQKIRFFFSLLPNTALRLLIRVFAPEMLFGGASLDTLNQGQLIDLLITILIRNIEIAALSTIFLHFGFNFVNDNVRNTVYDPTNDFAKQKLKDNKLLHRALKLLVKKAKIMNAMNYCYNNPALQIIFRNPLFDQRMKGYNIYLLQQVLKYLKKYFKK
jgi:hypothetical protein